MHRHVFLWLLLIAGLLIPNACLAQSLVVPSSATSSGAASAKNQDGTGQLPELTLRDTVKTAYLNAGMLLLPAKCDRDGNVYLRDVTEGVHAIHKLNAEGKQVALFQPDPPTAGSKPIAEGYFSVGKDGYVYELVGSWEDRKNHVLIYRPDGTLKTDVSLETGFAWIPAQVAAFPSGNFLVTGLKYDHRRTNSVKLPFTGVFGPDGSLLKEVKLEDDDMIHDMAVVGDSRVTAPEAPGVNHAVELGDMDAANDGNIYLMRRLSPAIVYAISPEGEVVRRFTVEAGQRDSMPESMHIAGNRIAVEFYELIKIVDLEGRELTTYAPHELPLEGALGCYSTNPERFTFLGDGDVDNRRVTLNVGGPRQH
jgi:hypothetical protein